MKTTNYSWKAILVVSWITSLSFTVNSQCDPTTPTFNVDLSASPFMSWTSPLTDRLDNCCGTTAPDKCLEFVITLHPDAASVVFSIASGAIPPGALFYQIDCGPITPVGTPICLTGIGPFHLTFCKPGNNKNTFTIQTIPNPSFGPDLTLSDGCSGELSVYFYDESSITWNSIQPGAPGAYNGLLSCISGCDTTTVSGSPVAPALVGYQVCGIAANGCILGPVCDTLFVTNVSPIQVSISSPDTVLCFNEPTTTLTADIVGGAAPYSFNWSSGQTTQTITVGPGVYTVTVNDSLNCQMYQDQITVVQLPTPAVNAGLDINVCSNSVVSVALGGSSANTSAVIWNGGLGVFAPNNTTAATTYFPTAAEIASGSLTLTLQSDDVSGCPDVTDAMTIFFHPVAQSVTVTPTDISCFGLTDGSVSVAVVGAEGPYTYSYDGGAYSASTTQNNLSAGNHTVSVLSAMGCDTLISFTIVEPALLTVVESAHTDVACFGENNGSSTGFVSGGTLAYAYSWNTLPVQTTATASGLISGNYVLSVTDANGCATTMNVTITEPPLPAVNAGLDINVCSNAVVSVALGGSSANTSAVIWNGGLGVFAPNNTTAATSYFPTAAEIAAGALTLTLQSDDVSGCPDVTDAMTIFFHPVAQSVTVTPTDISCFGLTDGSVSVAVVGAEGPYTYSYDGGAYSASTTQNNLSAGNHTVSVLSAMGCDTLISFTIVEPALLTVVESAHTDVACFGENNGSSTGFVSGGTLAYAYSWNTLPVQTTATANTLTSGNYVLSVTDANGCATTMNVTITEPPLPAVNAGLDINVCSNSVVSVALGGSSANTSAVIWNGGLGVFAPNNTTAATTYFPTAAEIASGSLTLTLQSDDVSGCPDVTDAMTIFFHPVAQSVTVTPTDISCFGLTDGSVSVAVVGAEGPYTYSYDGGAYSASTTQNNLSAGNHTVSVLSAMGCDTLISFTIVEPALLTVVESAHTDVACFGENNGSSTGFVSGGTLVYTYSWNTLPVQTTATASGLISGNYVLSVTDANGCATTMNVTITEPPLPAVNAGLDINVCSNAVVSVALGGSSANTSAVIWNGGLGAFAPNNTTAATTYFPTAAEIAAGSLTLTLQSDDVSGCPDVTDAMTIFFHPVAQSVTVTPTDISCFGLTDGSVSVAVVGAEGPYTYSYDGGAYSASTTQNNLSAGNHTVSVLSAMGCDTLISFTIVEPTLLTVVESAHTDVACFGENNGSSTGFVSGGTLAYSYSWNTLPVQTTATASGLISGNYTLSVTDANGCATSLNVAITEPPLLQLSFNIVPPSCNGFANGDVSSNVVGGVAPYTYLWSTTETGTAIHDVSAGQYSLTITDGKGCVVSSTAVVTEPNPLIVTVSADTTICPGTPLPLNAIAQGGSGTYQYNWVPGGNGNSIVVNPMSNQTYSCTVTDNNGCIISANVQVNTFSLNPADLSIAAGSTTLCLDDSTQLVATYTGNDPTVVLVWSHCPACAASTMVTPLVTTIYTVTATNQCGQQLTANQLITVTNPPMVSLNPSMGEICVNESVSFSSQGDNDPSWGYEWTFGDGDSSEIPLPTHIYTEEGHYAVSLTVHTTGGCLLDSVMFSTVIVHPRALAIFSSSSFSETTMDPTFHFTNNSQNASIYSWDFGDGTNSVITSPSHTYETYGYYTIVLNANNEFNCPGSTDLTVEVTPSYDLYVPNAFTPDGDKSNNIFQVQGYGIAEDGFGLQIFDRWGELIYSSGDMSEGWDGSNKKGEAIAQDGVYTWVVQFKDLRNGTHVANGHVSLLK